MKIYRAKELYSTQDRAGLLAISESGLYAKIQSGEFPAPNVKLGKRARGWSEDVLRAAIEAMRTDRQS